MRNDGRIASITKDSQTVTYTYDDTPETGDGKFLYLTLPNGIKKETIFSEDTGRLETIRYSKDSKVLYQFDYTFDNRGNISRKITTKPDGGKITEHYNYDIINRLNSVIKEDGGVSKTAYAFDSMGNRLSKRMSGFTSSGQALDKTENYDYDACDQLTCVDGVGFEYDLNGNLAKKRDLMAGDMVYKFNYANRLREVLFADGTKAQYVYKSDGMRISRTDRTGKTTKYYRDSSNIPEALNEGDEDGNITLNLFPGTGFKSTKNGSQNSTQWRWFITDHLGSVIALTDNNGIVTDEYEYDEYGNTTQTKGSSYNPCKYIGQQYDEETGLIYLRARYYDSQTGRFVSRDPIGIRGGMNEYSYSSNPISFLDMNGLMENQWIYDKDITDYMKTNYTKKFVTRIKDYYINDKGYPRNRNDPNCSVLANVIGQSFDKLFKKYSQTHYRIQIRAEQCGANGEMAASAEGHVALAVARICPGQKPTLDNILLVLDPWKDVIGKLVYRPHMKPHEWLNRLWGCQSYSFISFIPPTNIDDKLIAFQLGGLNPAP